MRDRASELITPDYAGAIADRVCVHVWRGAVSVKAIQTTRRFVQHWDEDIRGVFVVIDACSLVPDEAARAEMSRLHDEAALDFVTIVCEGSGFRAASIRAVLTGMHVLQQTPYQTKVFATVTDAAGWAARNYGSLLGALDLPRFVRDLRRRADAKPA